MVDKLVKWESRLKRLEKDVSLLIRSNKSSIHDLEEESVVSIAASLRHNPALHGRDYDFVVRGNFRHFKKSIFAKVISHIGVTAREEVDIDHEKSSIIFHWHPQIFSGSSDKNAHSGEKGRCATGQRIINGQGFNDDKRALQNSFREVFGYRLEVDPVTHQGSMVQKSRINAVHDGRILNGPIEKHNKKYVYQRLVDNRVDSHVVEDIRICIIGFEPVMCYLKYRKQESRFSNRNIYCVWTTVIDVLSDDEIGLVEEFCARIHLETGELDILRDRQNGKIYIVDANNTPYGPPNGIDAVHSRVAIRDLGYAFWRHYLKR